MPKSQIARFYAPAIHSARLAGIRRVVDASAWTAGSSAVVTAREDSRGLLIWMQTNAIMDMATTTNKTEPLPMLSGMTKRKSGTQMFIGVTRAREEKASSAR